MYAECVPYHKIYANMLFAICANIVYCRRRHRVTRRLSHFENISLSRIYIYELMHTAQSQTSCWVPFFISIWRQKIVSSNLCAGDAMIFCTVLNDLQKKYKQTEGEVHLPAHVPFRIFIQIEIILKC